MKKLIWMMMGTTIGFSNAQPTNSSPNIMGNVTAGSITNLTNGSASLGDANNMSVIEGTMNQTG
jgi:hypothetical protein